MAWESYRVGYVNRIVTPANTTVFCNLSPTDTVYGKIIPSHLAVQNGRGPERITVLIDGISYECGQYSNVAYPIYGGMEAVIINGNNPDVEVFLIDEKHAEMYLARYTSFPAPLDPAQTGLIRPEISISMTVCDNGLGGAGEIIVGNSNDVSQDATVTVGTDQQNQTIVANGIHTFTFTGLSAGTHAVNVVFSSGVSSSGMLVITSCQVPESKPLWVWDCTASVTTSLKVRDGFPPVVGEHVLGSGSAITFSAPTGNNIPPYLTSVANHVVTNSGDVVSRACSIIQVPTSWNFSLKFWMRRSYVGGSASGGWFGSAGMCASNTNAGTINLVTLTTMRARNNWLFIQQFFPSTINDIVFTGATGDATSTITAGINDWYHVGLYTRSPNQLEVWINGAFVAIINSNPLMNYIFLGSAMLSANIGIANQFADVRFYDSVIPVGERGITSAYYNF